MSDKTHNRVIFNIKSGYYLELFSPETVKLLASRSFDQLLNISPTNHIYTKTFHLEFSYIEVWFTNQKSMSIYIYIERERGREIEKREDSEDHKS